MRQNSRLPISGRCNRPTPHGVHSFLQPETYPPLDTGAYFLDDNFKRLYMLRTFHTSAKEFICDVNNFLKNEAEIITDFKVRLTNTIKEIDKLQSGAHITYNRIINKMNEGECSGFVSEQSLYMEENY